MDFSSPAHPHIGSLVGEARFSLFECNLERLCTEHHNHGNIVKKAIKLSNCPTLSFLNQMLVYRASDLGFFGCGFLLYQLALNKLP